MSESLHEMLDVWSWKASKCFVAERRVLRDARTSELLQLVSTSLFKSTGPYYQLCSPSAFGSRNFLGGALQLGNLQRKRPMSISLQYSSTRRPTCYRDPANRFRSECLARGCTWSPSICSHFRSRRLREGRHQSCSTASLATNRT